MKLIEKDFSRFSVTFHIGQNAEENNHLVQISNPEDIWFHAKQISSCHVVAYLPSIKLEKKELQKVIRQGSLLCKQHTKKLSSIPKVEIIYTKIKNIERTTTIGCVLTKEWKEIIV